MVPNVALHARDVADDLPGETPCLPDLSREKPVSGAIEDIHALGMVQVLGKTVT